MEKKKSVPAFLRNTYEMLEEPKFSEIVGWAESGSGFIIKNLDRFSQQILPLYFKHKKYASFVRQLNMYGFRKQRHQVSSFLYFAHEQFRRGQMGSTNLVDKKVLLSAIKRKPEKKKKNEQSVGNEIQNQENESQSSRSVSVVLQEDFQENRCEVQNLPQDGSKEINERAWSSSGEEFYDNFSQKIIEQNELLRSLHIIIRSQTLKSKQRTIDYLTTGVSLVRSEERESLISLQAKLNQASRDVKRLLQPDL